jgi:Tol biopolymer transport system component
MKPSQSPSQNVLKLTLLLFIPLVITSCGPSQFLGPTLTPTSTNTLVPTMTTTPRPTFTPTLTLTATQTPVPTPIGGGSPIAFSTDRDGNWEIYRMHSDGANVTRLTTSPSTSDWFPKFSLDGKLLLYWSYTEEPFSVALQWLQSKGSGGEFASNVAPYVSFAPDGKAIALTTYNGENNMDIGVGSVLGGELQLLTSSPASDYQPAWSSDGQTIAFVSERDGTPHIYLMDADGTNQRRLTKGDEPELGPAWSPDGQKIAFMLSESTTLTNIYIVNADGTNLHPLTNETAGYNENPVWSPDGTMLAFWSDRTGNHEIFIISPDGTGLVNLTNHPAADENPSWSK